MPTYHLHRAFKSPQPEPTTIVFDQDVNQSVGPDFESKLEANKKAQFADAQVLHELLRSVVPAGTMDYLYAALYAAQVKRTGTADPLDYVRPDAEPGAQRYSDKA